VILLIFASRVARITGISHRHPALKTKQNKTKNPNKNQKQQQTIFVNCLEFSIRRQADLASIKE
jgi:hypothetical protein